jgi:EpsI family protein
VTSFLDAGGTSVPPPELVAPAGRQGWSGPQDPDGDWTPAFPTADAQVLRAYESSGVRVTLLHARYGAQAEGREVINYLNRIEGGEGWTVTEDGTWRDPRLGAWRRCLLAQRDRRQRVVLYRYTIAGRSTASRLEAKLRQGLSAFAGDRSASILAASAPCRGGCEEAGEGVARFLRDMDHELSRLR